MAEYFEEKFSGKSNSVLDPSEIILENGDVDSGFQF